MLDKTHAFCVNQEKAYHIDRNGYSGQHESKVLRISKKFTNLLFIRSQVKRSKIKKLVSKIRYIYDVFSETTVDLMYVGIQFEIRSYFFSHNA